jgi:predicted HAD superfamily Cof-like phosphohydrolase
MTTLQKQVKEFMIKAKQDAPEKPIVPDDATRKLRVSLLLEEVLEFAEASGVRIIDNEGYSIKDVDEFTFEIGEPVNMIEIADSLGDINYVSYGAAVAYGLDLEPFEKEISENNLTKFLDGWRDENGKFRKGPSYKPVDLQPILDKQNGTSSL